MSLNYSVVNGNLPHFEGVYKEQKDDNGKSKSFLMWSLSVKRDYKKPDEKFYPQDLIPFKAYGANADFIVKNFNQGDSLILTGRLKVDDDYQDQTSGETKKGQLHLEVETVKFAEGVVNRNGSNSNNNANSNVNNNTNNNYNANNNSNNGNTSFTPPNFPGNNSNSTNKMPWER